MKRIRLIVGQAQFEIGPSRWRPRARAIRRPDSDLRGATRAEAAQAGPVPSRRLLATGRRIDAPNRPNIFN